jgi:hypothetical protein
LESDKLGVIKTHLFDPSKAGGALRRQTGDLVLPTAGEFELLCAFAPLNRDQLIDLVKGRE